jgi:hypothetical protein
LISLLPASNAAGECENVPEIVRKNLLPGEVPEIAIRQHSAILIKDFVILVVAFLIAGILVACTGSLLALEVSWAVCLAAFARLTFRVLTWSGSYFVVTRGRVMFIPRFRARSVCAVSLLNISVLTYNRSGAGRALCYGRLYLGLSREPYHALDINFMQYPDQVVNRISALSSAARAANPPRPPRYSFCSEQDRLKYQADRLKGEAERLKYEPAYDLHGNPVRPYRRY